jgi:ribosomal protein S26
MDIFAELDVIFSRYAKPSNYIDRDHCAECAEHYQELRFRRKLQMKTSEIITLCDLSSQGIELLCG